MFEVTPELLRWDIMIDVYTNINAPTINAVDRQQKLDFLTTLWTISQWIAVAKQAGMDVEKILPVNSTLRDLASDYNLEPQDKWWDEQEEAKQEKMKLFSQLQSMLWWQTMPQWAPEVQPQGQPQWALPTNPKIWQPTAPTL